MAKDYKNRASSHTAKDRRQNPNGGVSLLRWMLATAVAIGFAVFLVYLKSPGFNKQQVEQAAAVPKSEAKTSVNTDSKEEKPQAPKFDFYTILPKKEMVVPEYEVKTRTREEQIGKNKKTSYILQAGSYKDEEEADTLKAKLALMGIESKIQKAKVENVIWYRVKIGPYSQMNNVNGIMARLQKNGMKPVITEIEGNR